MGGAIEVIVFDVDAYLGDAPSSPFVGSISETYTIHSNGVVAAKATNAIIPYTSFILEFSTNRIMNSDYRKGRVRDNLIGLLSA